jgi:hypothetical protein
MFANSSAILSANQNLANAICCPISLTPLFCAQITNCHHSFSLESVQQLFGEMQAQQCSRPGPCPLCRDKVTAYFPNHHLQSLVNTILEIQQTDSSIDNMKDSSLSQVKNQVGQKFDTQGKYPLATTRFNVTQSQFTKNSIKLSLNSLLNENDNSVNKILCMNFNLFLRTNSYHAFISLDNSNSMCQLLHYLRQASVSDLRVNSIPTHLFQLILATANLKNFVHFLNLLIENNEWEDLAQSHLAQLMQRIESL